MLASHSAFVRARQTAKVCGICNGKIGSVVLGANLTMHLRPCNYAKLELRSDLQKVFSVQELLDLPSVIFWSIWDCDRVVV